MFPAVLAGICVTAFTSPRPLLLVLAAWMVFRIICLHRKPVLYLSILVTGGLVLVAAISSGVAKRSTVTSPQVVSQTLLVMPDEVQTNGSLVMLVGMDVQSGQRETATYRAKTEDELKRVQALSVPTRWQVAGSLQPIIPASNDNQFDPRFYYRQKRIYNELRINRLATVSVQPASGIRQHCHTLRARLLHYFATFPSPLAGYCRQLIIGDNHASDPELTTAVKRLGIIHLFCISGMHIILLANLTQLIGTYLRLERETLDGVLIVALPLYLIIGGGSTSLVRAVIMAEVALGQRLLKMDALDGWAVSLLIGLAWNPCLLFNLGGQLSYLLSLTLQVMEEGVGELKRCWWLGLLSLPAILYQVYEFHLLSLLASYVMIPLFSGVIFPLVLLSAVTYACFPLLGRLVNCLLVVFQEGLDVLAQLPGEIHFGKPAFCWALGLFLLTIWLVEHPKRRRYLLLLAAYLSCFCLIHFPLTGEVVFTDIGQGDSIIIRTPLNRRVLLIDTGGKLSFRQPRWAQMTTSSDLAKRTSINYLKSKGISRIDTVYLSHHDADHIGFLPTFLQEMTVKKIAVPAGMEQQPAFTRRLANEHYRGQVLPVTSGHLIDPELRILHPFVPGEAKNEDSMVLFGRFGGQNFLFTGDLDRAGELAVLGKYPQLRADVLKLGHHGSRSASDPRFLQDLAVKRAIISAGRFNRYHHPNDEVVAELHQAGISALSTQQYGMIKYQYYGNRGHWLTTLKGDELRWTLPNSLNS